MVYKLEPRAYPVAILSLLASLLMASSLSPWRRWGEKDEGANMCRACSCILQQCIKSIVDVNNVIENLPTRK